jgi:Flp pilus assembly CpaE family ATPase
VLEAQALHSAERDAEELREFANVGQPLLEFAREAAITRDLVALTELLTGRQRKPSKTLLRRLFPFLD